MNGVYGGLIIVIWYGGGGSTMEEFWLITQNNIDILTQTSQHILVQS